MFSHSGAYFAFAVVIGCLTTSLNCTQAKSAKSAILDYLVIGCLTTSLNCTQAKSAILDYLVVSVFFVFVYFLSNGTGQPA